jgi:hypothetical protein
MGFTSVQDGSADSVVEVSESAPASHRAALAGFVKLSPQVVGHPRPENVFSVSFMTSKPRCIREHQRDTQPPSTTLGMRIPTGRVSRRMARPTRSMRYQRIGLDGTGRKKLQIQQKAPFYWSLLMLLDVTGLLSGGGGGSRTRVRRYVLTEIYMRIRTLNFATRVKARPKPRWLSVR